jgi:hypothetical protein
MGRRYRRSTARQRLAQPSDSAFVHDACPPAWRSLADIAPVIMLRALARRLCARRPQAQAARHQHSLRAERTRSRVRQDQQRGLARRARVQPTPSRLFESDPRRRRPHRSCRRHCRYLTELEAECARDLLQTHKATNAPPRTPPSPKKSARAAACATDNVGPKAYKRTPSCSTLAATSYRRQELARQALGQGGSLGRVDD